MLVEALDRSFENVCELDLIFHSDKVHYIVDEIIIGGMVLETNINSIITAANEQARQDADSVKLLSSSSSSLSSSSMSMSSASESMKSAMDSITSFFS